MHQQDIDDTRGILDMLACRKTDKYASVNRFIVDYQVEFNGDNMMLHVASTIQPDNIVKATDN